jgi:hypothetical protein
MFTYNESSIKKAFSLLLAQFIQAALQYPPISQAMFWIAYLTKISYYAFKQTTGQEARYYVGLEHKKLKIKMKKSKTNDNRFSNPP